LEKRKAERTQAVVDKAHVEAKGKAEAPKAKPEATKPTVEASRFNYDLHITTPIKEHQQPEFKLERPIPQQPSFRPRKEAAEREIIEPRQFPLDDEVEQIFEAPARFEAPNFVDARENPIAEAQRPEQHHRRDARPQPVQQPQPVPQIPQQPGPHIPQLLPQPAAPVAPIQGGVDVNQLFQMIFQLQIQQANLQQQHQSIQRKEAEDQRELFRDMLVHQRGETEKLLTQVDSEHDALHRLGLFQRLVSTS